MKVMGEYKGKMLINNHDSLYYIDIDHWELWKQLYKKKSEIPDVFKVEINRTVASLKS